jgi:hypothetical protein
MTTLATGNDRALTTDELDGVVGGAFTLHQFSLVNQFVSALDKVALNPQPLPPMPAGLFRSFGR